MLWKNFQRASASLSVLGRSPPVDMDPQLIILAE